MSEPRHDGMRSPPGKTGDERAGVDRRLYGLIILTTVFGIGHHIDHLIRGNHVGWPVIPEVTAFTYSLAVYPLIAVGLYLSVTDRVDVTYWVVVLAATLALVVVVHFGPWAIEPPGDVVGPYENASVGYFALVWLFGFVGSLVVATGYSVHRWWVTRPARAISRRNRSDSDSGHP